MRLLTILAMCWLGTMAVAQRGEARQRPVPQRGEAQVEQRQERLQQLRERVREHLREAGSEGERETKGKAARGERGERGEQGRRGERPQRRSAGDGPRRGQRQGDGRGRLQWHELPPRVRLQLLRHRMERLRDVAAKRGEGQRQPHVRGEGGRPRGPRGGR